MDFYYTENECVTAINKATQVINKRTEECLTYTRGTNDCAALLVEYDTALRGGDTKSDIDFTKDFQWSTPREFLVKLLRAGYTMASYFEHCGYKLIKNKRPIVGDVALLGGGMIASPKGWITTTEANEGVVVAKQLMYLELNINIIARPIRS